MPGRMFLHFHLIDNGAGGTTQDFSNQINAGSTTKAVYNNW